MAMEIMNNVYSSYAAQSIAESSTANRAKKKETEKTTDYANELAKLVPSVDFRVGNSIPSAKSGKTLTINPKLLEKMQNDPAQEKETKELIRGVEFATKLIDSIHKASGWTVVYRHSYIDENGKYCAMSCVRNDFMLKMSDKLREERRKNSEKLLEKSKAKAAEKKEKLEKTLEKKKAAKTRAEQLVNKKMAASKDGTIYLDDTDMKTIIEAAKEDNKGKTDTMEKTAVGVNVDVKV